MLITFYIIVLLALTTVIYQDFKYRAISWILLPILFFSFLGIRTHQADISEALTNTVINLVLISLQLLMALAYFTAFRKTSASDFTRRFLGWGDILFFIALTPAFSFPVYLVYLLTGLIITLAVYSFRNRPASPGMIPYQIPLAGVFALYTIAIKTLLLLFPAVDTNLSRVFLFS